MSKSTHIIKDFCKIGGYSALPLRDVPQIPQEVTPTSSPWPKHMAVFQESNWPCCAVHRWSAGGYWHEFYYSCKVWEVCESCLIVLISFLPKITINLRAGCMSLALLLIKNGKHSYLSSFFHFNLEIISGADPWLQFMIPAPPSWLEQIHINLNWHRSFKR